MSMVELRADPFRLLGETLRLRILRLLARERLSAGELVEVLGAAQSGVSRHLGLLRDGGFVQEAREGSRTRLTLAEEAPPGLGAAWPALRADLETTGDEHGDDARLAAVLRLREERRVGWGTPRAQPEPGRSWAAWARALGHLLPPLDVLDVGCGEGALTLEVACWAGSVTGVDPDAARLASARASAETRGVEGIRWVPAPLEHLPFEAAAFDLALLSQSLHVTPRPNAALAEAARVTRPGGTVLVLDLLPHREAWVTETLGHRHLGFAPSTVTDALEQAGLVDVRCEEAARRRGNPFTVLVASGRKPVSREEA